MKKLIALLTALCLAATAGAAPKKDDKAKDDKNKKKEVPAMMWDVVIEGATTDTAEQEVKALLAADKNIHVESVAKKDNTVEAVVSSKMRLSRSDITRALRENKALKVKDFKSKKPAKEGDKEATDKKDPEKKPDAPATDKKPEEMPDKKPGDKEAPKKDAPSKLEPKKDAPSKLEPKKDAPAKEEPAPEGDKKPE